MSHFVGIVLLPEKTTDIEHAISDILAPYSENLVVEEYDHECSCKKNKAWHKARQATEEKLGTFEELRKSFHEKVDADPILKEKNKEWHNEEVNKLWQEHIKEFIKMQEDLEKEFLETETFNEDCDCKGTGFYKSTYNPNSKWDWFSIGGRWTGFLYPSYDPQKDENNRETCTLCGGSGVRTDLGESSVKCNGCDGNGIAIKWPTEWVSFQGDVTTATRWLAMLDQGEEYTPYSIVTPDGEWHQRGEMGWWGLSRGDKPKDEWHEYCKKIAEKYASGHIAVVVDYHI